jgi:hypothetical protein
MNVMSIEVALSAILGLTFVASAVPKLRHHKGFILAVLEYRVLPPHLSRLYARLVPPLELLTALLLLSGTAVRSAATTMSLLLLSFIIAIGINLVRGHDLDCHCFGSVRKRPIGSRVLLQDSAQLGASITVALVASEWVAPEPWSVFHLFALTKAGSLYPLLVCIAVTTGATLLLSKSMSDRRRRYANKGT